MAKRTLGKPVEYPPRVDAQDEEQRLVNIPIGPSSQIASLMYDPRLLELICAFANGSVYKYSNVDQVTVDGYKTSASPGRYHYLNVVQGGFEYERLE
jgi:hypothetical protein